MSFSQARQRFYQRLRYVEPADVEAMRVEENGKLDEQERHLLAVMVDARRDGNLTAAVAALRALEGVSRSRRALNGLDAPVRHEVSVSMEEARTEIDEALAAYLTGVDDAAN